MAIAGLHNIPVLDSSFLREPLSQASRHRENDGRESTHASSVLQMWRELEDEHVVNHAQERVSERLLQQRTAGLIADFSRADVSDNHGSEHSGVSDDVSVVENEFGQWSPTPSRVGSQNSSDDPGNFHCELFSDIGEVERERVRRTFREWINSGMREHTSTVSHINNSSRAEWLGETEQERVRIIRGWVQMNSQQRGVCGDTREEQGAEVAGQIGRVLDGMIVNQNGVRPENIRRGIRRLCGRQALLDMLKKAERERQRELQGLLEHCAVSNFAHRNRIQSLLRGRFLRNDRMVEDERPASFAASELGLLRQRHTVSGLREGFISRLDHSVCGQQTGSNHSDNSSDADTNSNRNEQNREGNLYEVNGVNEQSERNNSESDSHRLFIGGTDLENDVVQDINWQESTVRVEEWQGQVSENVVRECQQSASVEFSERRDGNGQGLDVHWEENIANESSQETLENESGDHYHLQEAGEIFYEQSQRSSEGNAIPGLIDTIEILEGSLAESTNQQETAAQEEQQQDVLENEETGWQGTSGESNEPRDGTGEDMDENLEERTNQWLQGLLGNEDREQLHLQETPEAQHDDGGLQEAMQNWFEGPSDLDTVPVGRAETFYLPDDDNVYSMELRELLSRRHVSNLLRSGFRENLDQLIQSYVERQNHIPMDWELDETSPTPATADQDLEQQSGGQNEGQVDAVESPPLALLSPPVLPVPPPWDQVPQHDNLPPREMHQHFGIELEIINDLRIDMARLQQRMNSMQRMLEACMDMQLELQRSIRQEVSAALNQSADSTGVSKDNFLKDGSKWDYVRKGMCCMCFANNIDSLLYRCGHMCTCSKCANELVQGGGKCPMCRAPVVEVIRVYSIS